MLILMSISFTSFTQNSTNSPYTRFGLGEISDNSNGSQRAMGGTSIGFRSPKAINTVNPASYSAVDSLSFMFDIGASGLYSRFTDGNGSVSKLNGNLEYITIQFPVHKHIALSAGLLPYSFSGYSFYDTRTIIPDTNYPTDTMTAARSYSGDGTISQVYFGLAFDLFNHISFGANAYYMFGSISNNRAVTYSSTTYTSSSQSNKITINDFRFRYGVQYYNTFSKKHDLTIGAYYEPKTVLKSSYTKITSAQFSDTISNENYFDAPQSFGIGAYYTFNNKLSFGLDYSLQQWSDARFFGVTDSLSNRSKISLGFEYVPNTNGTRYSQHLRYRAGLSLSDSYYNVNGQTMPKNISVTAGVGIPVPRSNSMINASFEYGIIGNKSTMREDYLKFTLSATINELWFMKRKL